MVDESSKPLATTSSPESTSAPATESSSPNPYISLFKRLFILSAVATYLSAPVFESRTFFDLTVGDWIKSHKQVPRVDLWTLVGEGHSWQSPGWLYQLSLSLIREAFPHSGLLVAKLTVFFLLYLALSFVLRRLTKDTFFATSLAVIVGSGIGTGIAYGHEFVGFIFFALLLGLAFQTEATCTPLVRTPMAPTPMTRGFWLKLFLLSAVSANLCNLGLWAGVAGLVVISERKRGGMFLLMVVLGGLFTPYFGVQMLSGALSGMNTLATYSLLQLQPGTIYHFPISFMLVLWVLLAMFWHYQPQTLHRGAMLAAVGTTLLAFAWRDLAPYALIVLALTLAMVWEEASRNRDKAELGKIAEGIRRLAIKLGALPSVGVTWLALCVTIVNVVHLFNIPVAEFMLPVSAVNAVLEDESGRPVFHSPDVGGYLIYRFANEQGEPSTAAHGGPQRKVLFDERVFEFDSALGAQLIRMRQSGAGFSSILPRFGSNEVLCHRFDSLCAHLLQDGSWQRIFPPAKLETTGVDTEIPDNPVAYDWEIFRRR